MNTCRCGQTYEGDLPWSDPEHDIIKCAWSYVQQQAPHWIQDR